MSSPAPVRATFAECPYIWAGVDDVEGNGPCSGNAGVQALAEPGPRRCLPQLTRPGRRRCTKVLAARRDRLQGRGHSCVPSTRRLTASSMGGMHSEHRRKLHERRPVLQRRPSGRSTLAADSRAFLCGAALMGTALPLPDIALRNERPGEKLT